MLVQKAAGDFRGQDYSISNPTKVRQGLRVWTEAVLRLLAQQEASRQEQPGPDE